MLTIIIAIRPVPRRRSGRHRAASLSQPNAPDTTNATTTADDDRDVGAADRRSCPGSWSTAKATRAPKVISSPWAKLVSPVVPKIIDRPSAAIASSTENTRPPTASCSASTALPAPPGPAVADRERHRLVVVEVDRDRAGQRRRARCPRAACDSSSLTVKDLPRCSTPGRRAGRRRRCRRPRWWPRRSRRRRRPRRSRRRPRRATWGDSRRSQIRPRIEIVSSSVGLGSAHAVALPDVGAVADVDADAAAAPPPSAR